MRDRFATAPPPPPLFNVVRCVSGTFFSFYFFLSLIYCNLSELSSGDKESAIQGLGLKEKRRDFIATSWVTRYVVFMWLSNAILIESVGIVDDAVGVIGYIKRFVSCSNLMAFNMSLIG